MKTGLNVTTLAFHSLTALFPDAEATMASPIKMATAKMEPEVAVIEIES
jgi:hypothetical protein